MERCGGMEFRCQMGLGFNLCVTPLQDCCVPISEGQGFVKGKGAGRYWGMKG